MKIKVGIIGAGGVAQAHAESYRQLVDQVELVAVADIDPERANAAGAAWGVKHILTDYRQLLAIEEIDAISICTYNKAHCAPTVAALEAGKHVLVEKPMAATSQEAIEMTRASLRSKKIFMVEMKWRFMPQILAAKAAVDRGDLGNIYFAEAIGWQHRGIPGRSFIRQDMAGGGALMDNGVYTLDAILYMLGHPKPLTVSGTAANVFGHSPDGNWDQNEFSVEDFGSAYVRLEGGITLFFAHAWAINFAEQWQMRLAGTSGGAEIYPFGPEPKLRLSKGGYTDLQDITPSTLPAGKADIPYAIERFVEAISQKEVSPVPADTFWYTNLIFDALYKSSSLGKECAVEIPQL